MDRIVWAIDAWAREDAPRPSWTAVSTNHLYRTQPDHALPPSREHEWSVDRAPNSDRRSSLTLPRSQIESFDIFGGRDAICARSASNGSSKCGEVHAVTGTSLTVFSPSQGHGTGQSLPRGYDRDGAPGCQRALPKTVFTPREYGTGRSLPLECDWDGVSGVQSERSDIRRVLDTPRAP